MASNWSEEFFSQYTPLIRDGRAIRANDGMLVFIRAADGVYTKFHDTQIDMEELDSYIRSDLIANAAAVTDQVQAPAQPQFDLQNVSHGPTSTGHSLNSPSNVMVQVSSTGGPPMHLLTPQDLQSLQGALQVQVSQHQQPLQQTHPLQQQQQQQQHPSQAQHHPSLQQAQQPPQHHPTIQQQQHHHNAVQHHTSIQQHPPPHHTTILQQQQQQQYHHHHHHPSHHHQQQQQQQHLQHLHGHQHPPHPSKVPDAMTVQVQQANLQKLHQQTQLQQKQQQQQMQLQAHHHQQQQQQQQRQQQQQPVGIKVQTLDANVKPHVVDMDTVESTLSESMMNVEPMFTNSDDEDDDEDDDDDNVEGEVNPPSSQHCLAPATAPPTPGMASPSTDNSTSPHNTTSIVVFPAPEKDGGVDGGADTLDTGKSSAGPQVSSDAIWVSNRSPEARQRDREATKAFIRIVCRPEVQAKLNDRTIMRKLIWQTVGEEMAQMGFALDNPGVKCAQKWRNMERSFRDYELSKHAPEGGLKRLPDFYEELKSILGDKHVFGSDAPNQKASCRLMEEYVDHDSSSNEGSAESHGQPGLGSVDDGGKGSNSPSNASAGVMPGISTVATTTPAGVEISSSARKNSAWSPLGCAKDDLSQSLDLSDSEMLSHLPPTFGDLTSSSHSGAPVSSMQATESSAALSQLASTVKAQSVEIAKLGSEMASIKELLLEQKRDREVMQAEATMRYEALKSTIEQNQREKMKFMCEYLKTVQALMEKRKKRKEKKDGSNGVQL